MQKMPNTLKTGDNSQNRSVNGAAQSVCEGHEHGGKDISPVNNSVLKDYWTAAGYRGTPTAINVNGNEH